MEFLESGYTTSSAIVLTIEDAEDGGLKGTMAYGTELFERETVQQLLDQYGVLLESIAADPFCPISELEIMTETERELLGESTDQVE